MESPQPNASLEMDRLEFSWQSVDGADAYSIEVCSDASCEALVKRAVDLPSPNWVAEELPLGDLYWRVTAVSPGGLDGYPAVPEPFSVAPGRAEFDPPIATFSLPGLAVERTLEGETRTYYAPTAPVRVAVEDASGVARWQPLIDEAPSEKGDLDGVWTHGLHTVTVEAVDELGNRGQQSVSFAVDGAAPELTWRIGGRELLDELSGEESLDQRGSRWWLKARARRNARRVRSHRVPYWTVIAWGNEDVESLVEVQRNNLEREVYRSDRGFRLTGEMPVAVLLAPGIVDYRVEGDANVGDVLVLQAADDWAGIEDLIVTTTGSPASGYKLRARARDRLGNVDSSTWDFGSTVP